MGLIVVCGDVVWYVFDWQGGVSVVQIGVCFFFKQKTAYEMRISDWSSDVCSSDLCGSDRSAPPFETDSKRSDPDPYRVRRHARNLDREREQPARERLPRKFVLAQPFGGGGRVSGFEIRAAERDLGDRKSVV